MGQNDKTLLGVNLNLVLFLRFILVAETFDLVFLCFKNVLERPGSFLEFVDLGIQVFDMAQGQLGRLCLNSWLSIDQRHYILKNHAGLFGLMKAVRGQSFFLGL